MKQKVNRIILWRSPRKKGVIDSGIPTGIGFPGAISQNLGGGMGVVGKHKEPADVT